MVSSAGRPPGGHATGTDTATDTAMRKIIHIDMDCFFAAVEMRDNPALREVPLAIGGAADRRGVISTCNYGAWNGNSVCGIDFHFADYLLIQIYPCD